MRINSVYKYLLLTVAIIIFIIYLYMTTRTINILTAIVCIDRDADVAQKLYLALENVALKIL